MTPKQISNSRVRIERKIADLYEELKKLKETCTHPNQTKKFGSDTGNWSKSDDSYWVDYDCPDCGAKRRVYD